MLGAQMQALSDAGGYIRSHKQESEKDSMAGRQPRCPINAYNEDMAARTVHVYRSDGAWTVKKEGKSAKIFSTQRKAVDAAKESVKKEKAGQFVVHGKNGQIREYGTYRMTRIQDPPKQSRMAGRIARAVGKVALERVQSDPCPPSEHSAKN